MADQTNYLKSLISDIFLSNKKKFTIAVLVGKDFVTHALTIECLYLREVGIRRKMFGFAKRVMILNQHPIK